MWSGRIFGGVAVALFTTLSAHAADMGVPVAPAPAPYIPAQFYWTGFYVGAHAGGGWGTAQWIDALPAAAGTNGSVSPSGFLIGSFVGLNYQIGWAVIGVEGDFDGTWFNSNTNDSFGDNIKTQVFWTATVTGRFGVAFDRLLIYGKGGVAFAYDRETETTPATGVPPLAQAIGSGDHVGWTGGGGVEYAFTEHWTGRIEYDYLSFASKPYAFVGGFIGTGNVGMHINEAKAGFAYKF
jgi:outer membrane immunogenic protein